MLKSNIATSACILSEETAYMFIKQFPRKKNRDFIANFLCKKKICKKIFSNRKKKNKKKGFTSGLKNEIFKCLKLHKLNILDLEKEYSQSHNSMYLNPNNICRIKLVLSQTKK